MSEEWGEEQTYDEIIRELMTDGEGKTFDSLYKKGLIQQVKNGFPTSVYGLKTVCRKGETNNATY